MRLHSESSHDSEVVAFNALEHWIKLLRAKKLLLGFIWKSLLGKIIILPCLYSGVLIGVAGMQIFNNSKHQVPLSFWKIWELQLQITYNWSTGIEPINCKSLILATCYLKPHTENTYNPYLRLMGHLQKLKWLANLFSFGIFQTFFYYSFSFL